MSVMSAPPRRDVYLLWGEYGVLGGTYSQARARLWLLTDDPTDRSDITIVARAAWNHPTTGAVVYKELGEVTQALIRPTGSMEVHLSDGKIATLAKAPCVCGAGSVGAAMPDSGRISLNHVNPYNRDRIVFP